jgi:hypothetical protein
MDAVIFCGSHQGNPGRCAAAPQDHLLVKIIAILQLLNRHLNLKFVGGWNSPCAESNISNGVNPGATLRRNPAVDLL